MYGLTVALGWDCLSKVGCSTAPKVKPFQFGLSYQIDCASRRYQV